jgi:predicted ATP-grasp superfamily ATP-dependent carboligase
MKYNHNTISVLIPDGESTLLSNVVYSLSLIKKVKIYVLSSHKGKCFKFSLNNNCFKYSRFIDRFIYYSPKSDEAWIRKIDTVVNDYGIDVIMPIFDVSTKRIIESKHFLVNKSKLVLLPELSDFNKALHKDLLYLHLKSNGLPSPKSIIIDSKVRNEVELDYPLIAKPTFGFNGGMGVMYINNEKELAEYWQINNNNENILLQEFIDGYDVTCNVLCCNGEIQAYTMQKTSEDKYCKVAPQYEFVFFEDEALLKLIKSLMKSLNWSGVANIDFRFDKKTQDYKVIEINPRFWLNTEASALAGVNFPYLYYLSSNHQKVEFNKVKEGTFLHLKALMKKLIHNPFFIFKISFVKKHTPLRFILKDPLVLLCKFFWRTNNIIATKVFKNKF